MKHPTDPRVEAVEQRIGIESVQLQIEHARQPAEPLRLLSLCMTSRERARGRGGINILQQPDLLPAFDQQRDLFDRHLLRERLFDEGRV